MKVGRDKLSLVVIFRKLEDLFCKISKARAKRHASPFAYGIGGEGQRAITFNHSDASVTTHMFNKFWKIRVSEETKSIHKFSEATAKRIYTWRCFKDWSCGIKQATSPTETASYLVFVRMMVVLTA